MESSVDGMESLASFLHSYGGWGLSALLMVALVLLYRSKSDLHGQMTDLLEKRTEELISVIRESTSVISQHHAEREMVDGTMKRMEGLFETILNEVRRR